MKCMLRRKTKESATEVRAKLSWIARADLITAWMDTPRQNASETHTRVTFEGPLPHVTLFIEGVGYLELQPKHLEEILKAAARGLDQPFSGRITETEAR